MRKSEDLATPVASESPRVSRNGNVRIFLCAFYFILFSLFFSPSTYLSITLSLDVAPSRQSSARGRDLRFRVLFSPRHILARGRPSFATILVRSGSPEESSAPSIVECERQPVCVLFMTSANGLALRLVSAAHRTSSFSRRTRRTDSRSLTFASSTPLGGYTRDSGFYSSRRKLDATKEVRPPFARARARAR